MTEEELKDLEYYRTTPCCFLTDDELHDYLRLLDKQAVYLEVMYRFNQCSHVGA